MENPHRLYDWKTYSVPSSEDYEIATCLCSHMALHHAHLQGQHMVLLQNVNLC